MESQINFAILNAQEKEEEKQKLRDIEASFVPVNPLIALDKLSKRHNIAIEEQHKVSDDRLFEHYMRRNPQPYYNYKKACNISRTLIKTKFKPKIKTGMDMRMD